MALFKTTIYFKTNTFQEIKKENQAHQNYLKSKNNVVYGGVSVNEEGEYDNILYIIDCANEEEAESFLKLDPYFKLVTQFKIENFIQKLPKI